MPRPPTYNPLDKIALAESVAKALLSRPCEPLPPTEMFEGAGIYAIYYAGRFEPYALIARQNKAEKCNLPIYVGKAVPPGARKGGFGLGKASGSVLYRRLVEHAETIRRTSNLELEEFKCRYLVTDDIWIPLGEQLLIEWFSPIWNKVIEGFGIHDPGKGRYQQRRSAWDTIHPGRSFAKKLSPSIKSADKLIEEVVSYLNKHFGGDAVH